MAKRFFLLAGLLALLAAAALLFLERPTLVPEATAGPATGAERVSPLSAKSGAKAPSVPAREAIAAPVDPDLLLDPETIPPEAPPLPMNDPVRLLVVERATGRPAPGAEVAWWVAMFRRIDPFYCGPLGWEEVLFESGRKLRTDSQGEALLPRTPWPISIAARSAGLLGVTNAGVQCCQETVHLPLDPVPEITIQVVDAGGKPQAGVPLILWSGRDGAPDSREVLWQGLSAGPEGTAKARPSWARLDAAPQQALVGFHPVLGSTPLVPIDLRFPPKETVRLTLPPAGSVVVRVQDEQGRTIQEGILVDLSVRAGAPRPTPQEGRSVLPPTRAIQAHVSQETTRFPHVALGSELSVMARSPRGARYPGVGQDLPGPTRAGEELELTLRFFFSASQLTGLVLVDAGARLENTLLKLVFTSTHNQVRQSVREGPRDREPWSRFRESG